MTSILIVDDNEDLRMLFRIILSDYTIIEACNGREAINLFQNHRPDLILMDILMPVMNGTDATREIIKIDSKAKILAITAHSEQIQDILDAGALKVIKKPIRRKDLIELVQNHTEDFQTLA